MNKAEQIRRLRTQVERMASQNGRDLRLLAKARGEIEDLKAKIAILKKEKETT